MATWRPVSGLPIQSLTSTPVPAQDYYIKFYQSGTTTPTNMATDDTGGTTLAKAQYNASGYAINGSGDPFIPHIDRKYRVVLYSNSTDADANTFANAIFDIDAIEYGDTLRNDLASTSDTAKGSALVAYLSDYANATNTTVWAFLQTMPINVVAHFGAVADSDGTSGNGTDNATAFANAIAAAKATGRALYFPGYSALGSNTGYRTTDSLFLGETVANYGRRGLKKIYGDGPLNTIIYTETTGSPGIDMTGGRYTILNDFQLRGIDGATRSSVGIRLGRVNVAVYSKVAPSSGEFEFRGVHIRGFFDTAAWYNHSAEWVNFWGGIIENDYTSGTATIVITDTDKYDVAASSYTTEAGDGGTTTYNQQSNIGHYFIGTTIFDATANAASTALALSGSKSAIKICSAKDVYFDKCKITLDDAFGTVFEIFENANITGTSGADANNDSVAPVGINILNNFYHEIDTTNTVVHLNGDSKDDTGMSIVNFNHYNNRGRGNGITSTGYVILNGDYGNGWQYQIEASKFDFSSGSSTSSNLSRAKDFANIYVYSLFDCSSFFEGNVYLRDSAATITIDVTKFVGKFQRLNALSPATQEITNAGAVDVIHRITELTITTNSALTLADGYEGQEKFITMVSNSGAHTHTLTPTSLAGYTTISFNAVGESVHLLFINGNWTIVGINGATLA